MEPGDDFKRVDFGDLIPVTEIDVRALADLSDQRDTYLTVYLGEEIGDRSFVESRLKAMGKALSGELGGAFQETLDMIERALGSKPVKGEHGRIIFASAPAAFLHVYRIGLDLEPVVVLDSSPFLLPLGRLRDEYEDYGILQVDSQEAELFVVRSDVLEKRERASIDLMNKHKKGGWSQMRFNRRRRGAIKAFLTDVVGDLQKLGDLSDMRGLVVAGPGEAKGQLVDMLPPPLREKVLGTVDLSMGASPEELVTKGNAVAEGDERAGERARVEALKAAILKGEPSAYGAASLMEALGQGRVDTLVLLDDFSVPGWICESCGRAEEGDLPERCPGCKGAVSEIDLLERLYQLAQQTAAEVEFVEEDAFLESIGGMGAILRY